jgi:hypothetical protein
MVKTVTIEIPPRIRKESTPSIIKTARKYVSFAIRDIENMIRATIIIVESKSFNTIDNSAGKNSVIDPK